MIRLSKVAESNEVIRRLAYWNAFNFGGILEEGCGEEQKDIVMYTMAGVGAYGSDTRRTEDR